MSIDMAYIYARKTAFAKTYASQPTPAPPVVESGPGPGSARVSPPPLAAKKKTALVIPLPAPNSKNDYFIGLILLEQYAKSGAKDKTTALKVREGLCTFVHVYI